MSAELPPLPIACPELADKFNIPSTLILPKIKRRESAEWLTRCLLMHREIGIACVTPLLLSLSRRKETIPT